MSREKWTTVYTDKADLYLHEFNFKEELGKKTALTLSKIFRNEFKGKNRVLDYPCGNGRISRHLASTGFEVLGIDVSSRFITDAQDRMQGIVGANHAEYCQGEFDDAATLKKIREFSPNLVLNWWTSFGYMGRDDDFRFFRNLHENVSKGTILFVETWHRFPVMNLPMRGWWIDLGSLLVLNENKIDPLERTVVTKHTYYKKHDNSLSVVDTFESRIILYDILEMIELFKDVGWKLISVSNTIDSIGSFDIHKDRVVILLSA